MERPRRAELACVAGLVPGPSRGEGELKESVPKSKPTIGGPEGPTRTVTRHRVVRDSL